ncbi:unnamed protein product [Amoebophrya sp. A25]|nr:unnamed protein product [Amoebophrya sp. A25]|eukprot:GSA25T00016701001.1
MCRDGFCWVIFCSFWKSESASGVCEKFNCGGGDLNRKRKLKWSRICSIVYNHVSPPCTSRVFSVFSELEDRVCSNSRLGHKSVRHPITGGEFLCDARCYNGDYCATNPKSAEPTGVRDTRKWNLYSNGDKYLVEREEYVACGNSDKDTKVCVGGGWNLWQRWDPAAKKVLSGNGPALSCDNPVKHERRIKDEDETEVRATAEASGPGPKIAVGLGMGALVVIHWRATSTASVEAAEDHHDIE